MKIDFAADVENEVARHHLKDGQVRGLAERCAALKDDGVDAHAVDYNPAHWDGLLDVKPPGARKGRIARGDVRAVADSVGRNGDPLDLFTAAYVWGQGRNGYGRARYDDIVRGHEADVRSRLRVALDALRDDGPVQAYALLWGGDGRATSPTRGRWSEQRIPGLGPAFFTKVLYFADRNALILDQVLARRVAELSGLRHFVNRRGRAVAWTPYRYAVYLEWMKRAAEQVTEETHFEVAPDLLELALFRARGNLADEGDAGI